jgi:hypothetical protein
MIWVKMRRDTSFVANPSLFDKFYKKTLFPKVHKSVLFTSFGAYSNDRRRSLRGFMMDIAGYLQDSGMVHVGLVDWRWRRRRE